MNRYALRDHTDRLDAQTQYEEIVRILSTQEFPWDIEQALSFALFRTYAVPSIGVLLHETGEFNQRTQKRYDDTVLILDAILEHGMASQAGRNAFRRMNQMHGAYDISNDDMRYVLSTFVVTPVRWLAEFGWRPFTPHEVEAWTRYYHAVGRHMGIQDIPETFDAFAALMDGYEARHFAFDARSRAVADATLELLATFSPSHLAPKNLVNLFARTLMDDALLDAFHYARPSALSRTAFRLALKARGKFVRYALSPRSEPLFGRGRPNIRSYPNGYAVEQLGTFPKGCPVNHGAPAADASSGARQRQ
ncbi:oxygenase MpaB family protein [Pyxidicoccus caerfyrddinensis]|uniref:oxygenase MpaB family protein n=1 Tax=Pyxidicoccus caerfyrddinensis TaxID=2709663 RepID=UPI001F0816CD|nr:oxygenase MpaB family protein [Pyxidicoccus caerfyrddinensis]